MWKKIRNHYFLLRLRFSRLIHPSGGERAKITAFPKWEVVPYQFSADFFERTDESGVKRRTRVVYRLKCEIPEIREDAIEANIRASESLVS